MKSTTTDVIVVKTTTVKGQRIERDTKKVHRLDSADANYLLVRGHAILPPKKRGGADKGSGSKAND